MAKFLRASVVLVALARRVAAASAQPRDDDNDQAHDGVEPIDDARLGRRDAHARRSRARSAPRRARQPVSHSLDRGLRRLTL